jgi:hypothetical protein
VILAHFSKSEGIFVISGSKLAMGPKIRAQLVVFLVADKPDKVAGNLTVLVQATRGVGVKKIVTILDFSPFKEMVERSVHAKFQTSKP